jgi:hypothetical protein
MSHNDLKTILLNNFDIHISIIMNRKPNEVTHQKKPLEQISFHSTQHGESTFTTSSSLILTAFMINIFFVIFIFTAIQRNSSFH